MNKSKHFTTTLGAIGTGLGVHRFSGCSEVFGVVGTGQPRTKRQLGFPRQGPGDF